MNPKRLKMQLTLPEARDAATRDPAVRAGELLQMFAYVPDEE